MSTPQSEALAKIVDRETSASLGEITAYVDDLRAAGDWTAADLVDGIAQKLRRSS